MSKKFQPDKRMQAMANARRDIALARQGNAVIAEMIKGFLADDPDLIEESAIASTAQVASQLVPEKLVIMLAVALYDRAVKRARSS